MVRRVEEPGTHEGPASQPHRPVPLHIARPLPHRRDHHVVVEWRSQVTRHYELRGDFRAPA